MCLDRVDKTLQFKKSKHDLLKAYKVVQEFRDLWITPFRASVFKEGLNETSLNSALDKIMASNGAYLVGFHSFVSLKAAKSLISLTRDSGFARDKIFEIVECYIPIESIVATGYQEYHSRYKTIVSSSVITPPFPKTSLTKKKALEYYKMWEDEEILENE